MIFIFFEKEDDIEQCKEKGVVRQIEDFIFSELERLGRGKREDITVAFEWDSNENVEANFNGDYFQRLR